MRYTIQENSIWAGVVNGILTDRRESQADDSEWIYDDRGSACTIDSVFLNWEDSGGKEYLLQVANAASDNGAGWQKRPIEVAQTRQASGGFAFCPT